MKRGALVMISVLFSVSISAAWVLAETAEDTVLQKIEAKADTPFSETQRQKLIQEIQEAKKEITQAEDGFVKTVTGFLPLPNYEVLNSLSSKNRSAEPEENAVVITAALAEKLKRPLSDSEEHKVRGAQKTLKETKENILENLARSLGGITGVSSDDCRKVIDENGI